MSERLVGLIEAQSPVNTCGWCRETFLRPKYKQTQRFCGNSCAAKWRIAQRKPLETEIAVSAVKLCECLGKCGLPTPLAKVTNPRRGHIKGQPMRLIKGHQNRRDLTDRIERDMDRTMTPDGCHEWTRYRDKGGYGTMKVNGRTRRVTHVVLELAGFMVPAKGLQALHRCDNPPCCRYSHLEIGPPKKNSEDMVARGRQARGERQGAAKLENGYATAAEIRRLFAADGVSKAALGRRYGVSASTIRHIINGETWNPTRCA